MKSFLTKNYLERVMMGVASVQIAAADTINNLNSNQTRSHTTPTLGGITNPVISPSLGGSPNQAASGATFSSYFITIWRALIIVGGLAVVFNFINGAIEWITAGGEQSKIQHARQKMTQAFIGFALLVGSFAMISFLGSIFGFNLLQMTLPTP